MEQAAKQTKPFEFYSDVARSIVYEVQNNPIRMDDHCYLMLHDPYSEGRRITESAFDQPQSDASFFLYEEETHMKSINRTAYRLFKATERSEVMLAQFLEA